MKQQIQTNKTEWGEIELGEISKSISAGGTPRRDKKEYWENGTIPWVKISDMKSKYISKTEENITEKGLKNSSAHLFPKETLIYSIFATLGAIGILEIDATTNQAIVGIIPKKEIISTKYLYYCLQAERNKILSKKSHATQDNLNLTILRNHKIPLPPLPIQKAIVSILEKTEKLKQKREQANKLADEYLKSVFYGMFGKKTFQKAKLKDLIIKIENKNPAKDFPEDYFSYIDISSVDNYTKRIITTSRILGKDAPSRAKQQVKTKDIILSTVRPNLNAVALIPKELNNQICSTGFCVLRLDNNKANAEYIFMNLINKKFIESMTKIAKGASYPAVSDRDILDFKIPLPPLPLQQKFASIVEQIEKLKEKQKKSSEEINNLFGALMQRAFRGELVK